MHKQVRCRDALQRGTSAITLSETCLINDVESMH